MLNILLFAPIPESEPIAAIRSQLIGSGFSIKHLDFDGPERTAIADLKHAFDGRPPDLTVKAEPESAERSPSNRLSKISDLLWGDDALGIPRLLLVHSCNQACLEVISESSDFLLPPFSPEEALARVRLLLYRFRNLEYGNTTTFSGLSIDIQSCQIRDESGNIHALRPREFELFSFLVTHRGKFFGRSRLLDLVWGVDFEGTERTVDIHIRRIRSKLPERIAELIETKHGVGYGIR